VVVDSSTLFFPAVFSWERQVLDNQASNSDRFIMPPHVVYFNSLISCLKKINLEKDDTVIIATEGKSWRKSYMSSYKAQREGDRLKHKLIDWEKVFKDLNRINDALNEATNFHILRQWNSESDDICAMVPKVFFDKECVIVTGDKDLDQLAYYPNVKIFNVNKKVNGTKGMYCLTEDAEILTNKGWKKYNEIKKHDMILSYNIKKDRIESAQARWVHREFFDGYIKNIKNRNLNINCSDNHKHLILDRYKKEITFKTANEFLVHDNLLLTANTFKYKPNYFVGEKWAELIGWFISEGSFADKNQKSIIISQCQIANKAKVNRIKKLLDDCFIPYKYYNYGHQFHINKCPFNDWIYKNLNRKKEPKYSLLNLPINELKALFNGLMLGDGHKVKNRYRFVQKNKYIVDWVELLAIKIGYSVYTYKNAKYPCYTVNLTIRKSSHLSSTKISKKKYKGILWCITTPNGTWIAKQNGQVFITGNSKVDQPLKVIADKVRLGDVSDNILVDKFNDTPEDVELRKLVIDLLNLPDFVEKPIREILENLPKKELHLDKLPNFKDCKEKFLEIYNPKHKLDAEYCYKLAEKRVIRKQKAKKKT
jgi:hypothetical protein